MSSPMVESTVPASSRYVTIIGPGVPLRSQPTTSTGACPGLDGVDDAFAGRVPGGLGCPRVQTNRREQLPSQQPDGDQEQNDDPDSSRMTTHA